MRGGLELRQQRGNSNMPTAVLPGAAMTITTISSRQFDQGASKAKIAAKDGPVFITDRGRPAHVLLTIEAYQRLAAGAASIIDQLAMPDAGAINFEPPRANVGARPADLS